MDMGAWLRLGRTVEDAVPLFVQTARRSTLNVDSVAIRSEPSYFLMDLTRGTLLFVAVSFAHAQNEVSLQWPFDLFLSFNRSGTLSKETGVTYSILIPQFPTQVDLNDLYSPITITTQCSGCGAILNPCLSVLSGAGPNSTCDRKICDDKPHTCTDVLPTSTSNPSTYKITFANENVLKGLNYSFSISTGCANTSRPLDKNVCAPVLTADYPTACVFMGGAALGNEALFGVDGCNCVEDSAEGGCSFCWDDSVPTKCDIVGGVQVCGPYCIANVSAPSTRT